VRGNGQGWSSPEIISSLVLGALGVIAFVVWEHRAPAPMLPLRLFRSRAFSAANAASLAMYFGMFGSIFLLVQFMQTAQGHTPLEAGLRTLPWTGMPALVAPIAGVLSDRVGGRPLIAGGLALQAIGLAWIASITTPDVAYTSMVLPFIVCGTGMGLFFAPIANVVVSAVRADEIGKASGANNAIREIGGVFGIAVLASIFAHNGGYATPQTFNDGLVPAVWAGAAVVAVGAVVALLIPGRRHAADAIPVEAAEALGPAA
jgi:nitrate/nitrite transporter NarK